MKPDKRSYPVSFPPEQVVALIDGIIKSRGWKDFKVAEIKLLLTPYWTFNFDIYSGANEGKLRELKSGGLALNANTNTIADLGENFCVNYAALNEEIPDEYKPELQQPRLPENEARELAALKVAAKHNVPQAAVKITALELVYAPMWIAFVTVAQGTYKLQINATSGQILNQQEVPVREKGWLEVTNETLDELTQPGAWVKYTKGVSNDFFSIFLRTGTQAGSPSATNWLSIVLILIAIVIILWAFSLI